MVALLKKRINDMHLEKIFEMQEYLNSTVSDQFNRDKFEKFNDEEKRVAVTEFLKMIQIETSEAMLACGNRWWKVEKDTAGGIPHLKEELVDILHFLTSAFIILGMTAEDVYNLYVSKNQKNLVREDWTRNGADNGNS